MGAGTEPHVHRHHSVQVRPMSDVIGLDLSQRFDQAWRQNVRHPIGENA